MHVLYTLIHNKDGAPDQYELLVREINKLMSEDFHQLVQVLYRIDVSEEGLKKILEDQPHKDAAVLIADLIIGRAAKKKPFPNIDKNTIPEEDLW